MPSKWPTIILRPETYERLKAFRQMLFDAYADGKTDLPDSQADRLSFGYTVARLLDEATEKRKRSAKPRTARHNASRV